ncbi:MAG: helix-turn-helix domain-containing protein [Chloroflexi bacterium]|nr:helix-turn-helix domain-containing protein [Chloroflexota bacterium]
MVNSQRQISVTDVRRGRPTSEYDPVKPETPTGSGSRAQVTKSTSECRDLISRTFRLEHDALERRFYLARRQLRLRRQEYELLCVFVRHARPVLSPEQLLLLVWGLDSSLIFCDYAALRTAVCRLRRQLGSLGAQLIQTRRGEGYCFVPEPAAA